ncbi:MAG: polysaccharide biosynthesis protein [Ruminococcaceae bacterium]|nr:polysaccharide biosynthesis protein [Oscillospiraceae bacterium]
MPGKFGTKRLKQNFLQGAVVLMIATILVKVIGALFKIPLMNMIGGIGMGYFNAAYQLFNPLYTLATAGMPIATARMVAESVASGRYKDARKIMKISRAIFIVMGVAVFILMAAGSGLFVKAIQNPNALWSVLALAPAVLFGCVMSSYRGYYQGMRNMFPTAISQVIEAVVKLLAGIFFAFIFIRIGESQYAAGGVVFGVECANLEQAELATLPYAAAGAVFGVTLSTLAGAIYLAIRHRILGDGVTEDELRYSPRTDKSDVIFKKLIKLAIPICLGALAMNITSLIDLVSIMNRLNRALDKDMVAVLTMYGSNISAEFDQKEIATYLYGIFSTMPTTLFNLIPAITVTFGTSVLPNITAAWTAGNRKALKKNVDASLRITSIIAMPAAFGMAVLARPILATLFSTRMAEVEIAVPMLQVMGIGIIFIGMMSPCNSILQGIGRVDLPVKYMLLGASFKLLINFIFVAIPSINIQAAPYGTLVCYIVIAVCSLRGLSRETGVKLNLWGIFVKPMFAGVVCAVVARLVYILLANFAGVKVSTVGAIAAAALVYVVVLLLAKVITKNDVLMLPKGEKIAKTLEKLHWIG